MRPPKADIEYDGRSHDCMNAIHEHILRLLDEAQSSGWRPDDIGEALISIGDTLIRVDGLNTLRKRGCQPG